MDPKECKTASLPLISPMTRRRAVKEEKRAGRPRQERNTTYTAGLTASGAEESGVAQRPARTSAAQHPARQAR